MPSVLLATFKPFNKIAVDGIEKICKDNGLTFGKIEGYKTQEELYSAAESAEACIVRSDKLDEEFFNRAKNLKIVVRAGAGVDTIDLDAASKHHVVVENTPGQNANAVAEMVFALLIAMKRNHFDATSGREIRGSTLGLYGCGNVSRAMIEVSKGFAMKCYSYDPFLSDEQIKECGAEPLHDLKELFKCDIVSLHVPATPQTINSINEDLMSLMPENGVLVDAARSEVIDEDSVISIFQKRPDLGYISDVGFTKIDELREKIGAAQLKKQLIVTPKKMGAQTLESNVNAGLTAIKQISAYFKDGSTIHQVNGKAF
ncbi:D-3-phosphoglycerate dehydrogenase, putative [Perkinsus marinus ATCC 50983]|uniref:D-3-phosphoglycerate dehydrogenase, putative n=1 Tax=Perkinsus marinus (strain ATCC 50983 / TXsc) TaxID=423536 RepID=C5KY35_PERM5|nr:D-3-phosphoglycerate dehydrogenase, putative [Perkinsus marinus ATCC 50983]EER10642.1 D-3-phosphoglycerate dehydrogenase, putative [Perkinsus marinus ATCC 50983]|eukprot:XP_002778847.1 D-3-phosphoglycerate dehydrogenase, putative [Perkinsus marinus ATCC 50983]